MINVLKSFINAIAAYSFVPLPYYEDEGDKYKYAFVPLIGGVIYWVSYGWFLLGWYRRFNDVAIAIGVILVVAIVTGGRHILGFVAYIDSYPTYKYRFISWSESRDRGVLRFIVVIALWFVAMLNTYDYIFQMILIGFILSRIYMGLATTLFNDLARQSKVSAVILIIELILVHVWLFSEFESLAITPVMLTFISFLAYINRFRRSTLEGLMLLEDDYIITAETTWLLSVAMVSLIRSL